MMGIFDFLDPVDPFDWLKSMLVGVLQWFLVIVFFIIGLSATIKPGFIPRGVGLLMMVGSVCYALFFLL